MNIGTREEMISYLMTNFAEGQVIALDTFTAENVEDAQTDLDLPRQLTHDEQITVLSTLVENYEVNTGVGFNDIRTEIAALNIK